MVRRITATRLSDGESSPALPGEATGSSGRGAWDGLVVEHHRVGAFELPESTVANHLICLHLDPPRRLGWRAADGRRGSRMMLPGDSTLVPAGAPRTIRSDGACEILLVSLEPDLVSRATRELVRGDTVEFPDWSAGSDPQIEHLGLALKAEADAPGGFAGRLYAETLAHALAVHLVRGYSPAGQGAHEAPGGLGARGLRLVTDYVGDNLGSDLSLRAIGAEVGMSPYGLSRVFKQSAGLTLHRYVTQRRLERAKALLAQTDLPVGEVCRRVGLTSQSHFARLFRERVGATPTAYREAFRGRGNPPPSA